MSEEYTPCPFCGWYERYTESQNRIRELKDANKTLVGERDDYSLLVEENEQKQVIIERFMESEQRYQKRIGELEAEVLTLRYKCQSDTEGLRVGKTQAEANLARAVTLLANLRDSWSPDDWEVGVDYPALMRDAECFLGEIEKEGK